MKENVDEEYGTVSSGRMYTTELGKIKRNKL